MLELYRSLFAPPRDLIPLVAAIWFGLSLAEKRSTRHGITKEDLNNIVFFPLLGYILGGRMLFALANLTAFSQNPASLISLNLDLFDPFGGLAVAGIVALIYGQRRNLPFWSTLDALTPFFAVFALGLGLGLGGLDRPRRAVLPGSPRGPGCGRGWHGRSESRTG